MANPLHFFRWNKSDRRTAIFAWTQLLRFAILLRIFPFKKILKHMGNQGTEYSQLNTSEGDLLFYRIKKSINRAQKALPFRCSCLNKVLVFKLILQKNNKSGLIYLGAKHHNKALKAHAWLQYENKWYLKDINESFGVVSIFKW